MEVIKVSKKLEVNNIYICITRSIYILVEPKKLKYLNCMSRMRVNFKEYVV